MLRLIKAATVNFRVFKNAPCNDRPIFSKIAKRSVANNENYFIAIIVI
jgi:hypothetical protein